MAEWKTLALILAFMDTLLLGLLVAAVVLKQTDINRHELLLLDLRNTCLPCGSEYTDSQTKYKDNHNFKREYINGEELCCFSTAEELKSLVKHYVEEQVRDDRIRQPYYALCEDSQTNTVGRDNCCSARVVGIIGTKNDIIQWDKESQQSFVGSRIIYKTNGAFNVSKKGFYYIYSHITFKREHPGVGQPMTSHPVYHSLYRQRADTAKGIVEKLVERVQPNCEVTVASSNDTSYFGAVFYIAENEEIMVRVTNTKTLTTSSRNNYFGLHLI